ncbi:hypothetical protein SBOR_0582 [Sclerotinia borealis F-4128]|uniref:Uncharacterized protein n=1 Tax=Sclerotinia borealis (strain F-4128) TaxID=1432307 RepID=W9CSE9_SCLBF|nr:hypothetical protein SBOR_0582 [Sclerotinia borealis F-4128]
MSNQSNNVNDRLFYDMENDPQMSEPTYHALQDEESSTDNLTCGRKPCDINTKRNSILFASWSGRRKIPVTWTTIILVTTLGASVMLNILIVMQFGVYKVIGSKFGSLYAGLVNDVQTPFSWNSPWNNPNDTERNKLWYESEDADKGIIAIDNNSKRTIYIAIDQYATGVSQSVNHQHVLHCLSTLRSEIICTADDTPRWTDSNGQKPGEGQERTCRDWSKLEAYVEEHTGCFKYIKPEAHNMSELERMKYCPNNSKYLPMIRQYFDLPKEWLPWPYVEQESFLTNSEILKERNST